MTLKLTFKSMDGDTVKIERRLRESQLHVIGLTGSIRRVAAQKAGIKLSNLDADAELQLSALYEQLAVDLSDKSITLSLAGQPICEKKRVVLI